MSTSKLPGGKGGRCVGLSNVLTTRSLKFLEPSGPVQGLLCAMFLSHVKSALLFVLCFLKSEYGSKHEIK